MPRTFTATAFFVLVTVALSINSDCIAEPVEPAPPKISDNDPYRDMVWNNALDSGTNVRYWSELAERAASREWCNNTISIAAAIFCLVFPFVVRKHTKGKKSKWAAVGFEVVGIVVCGWSLMQIQSLSAEYNELSSLENRWATIKPQWDELFKISHTLTPEELQQRYEALEKARLGIVPTEPPGKDEELMHRAWVQEMHARGVDADYIAKVEEDRKKINLQKN